MNFFLKFFKELNTAENEKAITLALAFGLIGGFLPFFNIFSLIIFILAFILRIPFGLYLASLSVFSIVGYFLDPIFAKTGYIILTTPIFVPLWEFLYNLPLMRWSGYNNTVVMGGFTIGIIFAIILFVILNKSIILYREKIFALLQQNRYLKWLVPDKIEKKGLFRISAVIVLGVFIALIITLTTLFLDPVLKTTTQFVLSKITRKPVKIRYFKTSFNNASVNIKGMSIGDFKIDKIYSEFSWKYILWKKFDIQNLVIQNLHTQKEIKELLNTTPNSITQNKTNKKSKLNIKLPNPKDLIKTHPLLTTQKITKLQKDYKAFNEYLKQLKTTYPTLKTKIDNIKQQINALKQKVKNIKSPQDIQAVLSETKQIKKEIDSIKSSIKKEKDRATYYTDLLKKDIKEVKEASKQDYQNLSKQYDMIKSGNYYAFAKEYLNPKISTYTDLFLKYYNILKPYLPQKSHNQTPKYVRLRGDYVLYKDKIKYPDFVLRKGFISAKAKNAAMKCYASWISSNQTLLKRPANIKIYTVSKFYKKADLFITYLNKIDVNFNLEKYYIKKADIKDLTLFNAYLNAKSKGIINKDEYIIKTNAVIFPSKVQFKKYLLHVKEIRFLIDLYGKGEKYDIKIKSNLDKIISSFVKNEINKKINVYKNELKNTLNSQVSNVLKDYKINDITQLDDLNSQINNLEKTLKNYTYKELEKRILKSKLKGFIKF